VRRKIVLEVQENDANKSENSEKVDNRKEE
jgi:hypothetical protein